MVLSLRCKLNGCISLQWRVNPSDSLDYRRKGVGSFTGDPSPLGKGAREGLQRTQMKLFHAVHTEDS